MKLKGFFLAMVAMSQAAWAQRTPNVEPVEYMDGDFPLLGYVSTPKDVPAPGVVIVPDWTNVDEYEQTRATMLAEDFGWVGFAADIYGPDLQGVEGDTRLEQALYYRGNNTLFYGRMQAAVDVLKAHPDVIPDKIAIIGYCFGGTGVLTYSFLGATDITGAVSFHGGLTDFPITTNINHPVLVLSGGDDDTSTQVEDLEEQLNAANATWQITRYSGIEHQFTVWDDPRYNQRANERSWAEMASFLAESFGVIEYGTFPPNATDVTAVDYEDEDGYSLTGYLAIPPGAVMGETPAVVIVPDWDGNSGPDGYEAQRATLLAEEGYVAIAADIFGSDLQQVEGFPERIELINFYHANYTLFVSRIQAAVDLLKGHDLVDPDKIVMIGYCFGGTGVVDYAFTDVKDVQVAVPFHGGLTSLSPILTDVVYPYVLVQSGGVDDAHGNNTELEMSLDGANATWEITRYSGVNHGFTVWPGRAYDPLADWRSWDAMLSVFDMVLGMDKDNVMTTEESEDDMEEEETETAIGRTSADGGWP